MIRVCRSGRNPTMKTLNRTHAVAISAMKETFDREDIELRYVQSSRQAADIYTKAFDNADKWREVCVLIGVYDMSVFTVASNIEFWANPPPTKATLAQTSEEAAPVVSGPGGVCGSSEGQSLALSRSGGGQSPALAVSPGVSCSGAPPVPGGGGFRRVRRPGCAYFGD